MASTNQVATVGTFSNNINFRQYTSRSNGATSLNKVSASFLQANTASNFLIAFTTYADVTSTATIADNTHNTWSALFPRTFWNNSAGTAYGWYAKNIFGGANVVTVSYSGTPAFGGLSVMEYSGVNTTTPIDTSSVWTGSVPNIAITISSSNITTNFANDWAIGMMDIVNGPITAGPGFTSRTTKYNIQDALVPASNTITQSTWSDNNTDSWINCIVAIKSS